MAGKPNTNKRISIGNKLPKIPRSKEVINYDANGNAIIYLDGSKRTVAPLGEDTPIKEMVNSNPSFTGPIYDVNNIGNEYSEAPFDYIKNMNLNAKNYTTLEKPFNVPSMGYPLGYSKGTYKTSSNPNEVITDNNNVNDTEVLKQTKTLWEGLDSDRKRQNLFGILGYGAQGLNAIADQINNSQQPNLPSFNRVIPQRIGYRPIDVEPYNKKIDQNIAGYKKYLMETGNASMLPAVIGNAMDKTNEYYSNVTSENNKGQMNADQYNAQAVSQADQINSNLDSQHTQLQLGANQYKDQAMKSNMQTLFGSVAGIGKTMAGNDSQKLKLNVIEQLMKNGNHQQAYKMLADAYPNLGFGDSDNTIDMAKKFEMFQQIMKG